MYPWYKMYLLICYHYFSVSVIAKNVKLQINRKKASKKSKLEDILQNNDQYSSKASRSKEQEKNELISQMWGHYTIINAMWDPGLDPRTKKKVIRKKTDEAQIRYSVYSMLILISWFWLLYHSGPTLGNNLYYFCNFCLTLFRNPIFFSEV